MDIETDIGRSNATDHSNKFYEYVVRHKLLGPLGNEALGDHVTFSNDTVSNPASGVFLFTRPTRP